MYKVCTRGILSGMEQTKSRFQLPLLLSFYCIRRLSGESGWRQLQWDADRKTPRVVTVAPEILLDETDSRPSSFFFHNEQSPPPRTISSDASSFCPRNVSGTVTDKTVDYYAILLEHLKIILLGYQNNYAH